MFIVLIPKKIGAACQRERKEVDSQKKGRKRGTAKSENMVGINYHRIGMATTRC